MRNASILAVRVALLLTLFIAGCAPLQWVRPDTDARQLAADQRACEADAYREVQMRYARSAGVMGPAVVGGPTGSQARRFNTSPQGPFADQRGTQLFDETQLTNECMRSKGYKQEPVRK